MTRPTGLTRDAGFQIGVSATLPLPPGTIWRFLTSREGLALWLGELEEGSQLEPRRGAPYHLTDGSTGEVRGYHEGARIRLTLVPADADHGTTVQVTVTPRAHGSLVRFHQERMRDPAEREARRSHWRAVMDAVANALAPHGAGVSAGHGS